MKILIKKILKYIRRIFTPVNWHNLRTLKPISNVFGMDRGLTIDRFYIEDFLSKNKNLIKGICCEISENYYTKKYGKKGLVSEVLDFNNENKSATIIGDLTKTKELPSNIVDCFILTQTLNFIYDYKSAIRGIYKILKKDGVALITVSGICQISKYDYDRWGDYYRFTNMSIEKSFKNVFGDENVHIKVYGNLLSAASLLYGLSADELNKDELFYNDPNYQVIITAKVFKR
jgi:hypothetical protein